MAVDGGYGPKLEPRFAGSGVPQDAADLTTVAAYAAAYGNFRVGTDDEFKNLSSAEIWRGLLFYNVDTDVLWMRVTGGLWYQVSAGTFIGTRTGQVVGNATQSTLGTFVRNSDLSVKYDFVTGLANGVTLAPGHYAVSATMVLTAGATGRTFVSVNAAVQGLGATVGRGTASSGEDTLTAETKIVVPPNRTGLVTVQVFQTTGAANTPTTTLVVQRIG